MEEIVFSCEQRKGFVRSSILVRGDLEKSCITYVYLNHFLYGMLKIDRGVKTIHRWEEEDEAQDVSFMSKHYTSIGTVHMTENAHFEQSMLDAIRCDLEKFGTENELEYFLPILSQIQNGTM